MPATKVIKPKPVERAEQVKARQVRQVSGARADLQVPAVRQSRAASCSRCPQVDRCERRTRSSSTAPRTGTRTRTNPDCKKTSSSVTRAAVHQDRTKIRPETKPASHSHKAFTVIPPNPKKRRDMQRKAEAELAALEELRLSRAMTYVSIHPSSVGGCMSLEEVRSKQQQEMMQAKRKQKLMKTQAMEQTPALNS